MIVFELGSPVDADEFRRAGLRVVDSSHSRLVVAFADDPELAAFHERLDALEGGIPEGQKHEPYAGFFDGIDELRPLGPEDRLADEVRDAVRSQAPDAQLRLDIECWHPGESDRAREWLDELRTAVEAAEGRFVDSMANDGVGLLLARVYVRADRVMDLAQLDVIARIDVLPIPVLSVPQLFDARIDDLPEILPPADGAPVVGLVDSGVASAHELLAGAVIASDALGTGIDDDQDEHGHGTMVASILLHGDVPQAIARGLPLRPMCRIASARVLDARNLFPDEELWERDLADAIVWCVNQGASILNLSLGDGRSPFRPPRQMTAAAVVDELARRHGLVVVIAAGNTHPADYIDVNDESAAISYPAAMLKAEEARLIDPATSMLALTVGGMTEAAAAGGLSGAETVRRIPMGRPGWPSPITRTGPGPGGAVKPEMVHRSGTLGIEEGRLVSNDAELGVVGARAAAGRLLSWDVGTSYSAPAVARVAAGVRSRFPDFSAEATRSLVLLSTQRLPLADELEGTASARLEGERLLVGYGKPSLARAIESTTHRAVLVAGTEIPIDGVHIYEVPVPSSFLQSGGTRGIDIALAFSPRTRVRRLDYMASRVEFHLVKGLSLDETIEVFAKVEGEDLEDEAVAEEGQDAASPGEEASDAPDRPPSPSELRSHLVKLDPPTQVRSRGANQLGRRVFAQRLDAGRDCPMFLVVRNVNRWEDTTASEPYALSVALWRDEGHQELHAELEAQLEVVIELPVEVELEL
ncbi:MAG: S8 family peptidase [Actinomycetota bacterium]|nr:S8 family peptidase [Actinomycetota bacterium]